MLEHAQTASYHKIIFSIFAAQTAVYCSPAMRLKAGKRYKKKGRIKYQKKKKESKEKKERKGKERKKTSKRINVFFCMKLPPDFQCPLKAENIFDITQKAIESF